MKIKENLKIMDCVYGAEEISEYILIDLVNSSSIQRLKGIELKNKFRDFNPSVSLKENIVFLTFLEEGFCSFLEICYLIK